VASLVTLAASAGCHCMSVSKRPALMLFMNAPHLGLVVVTISQGRSLSRSRIRPSGPGATSRHSSWAPLLNEDLRHAGCDDMGLSLLQVVKDVLDQAQ
jgi:hypothetical protein